MAQNAADRKENNQFAKVQLMSHRFGSNYQSLTYLFTYVIDKTVISLG